MPVVSDWRHGVTNPPVFDLLRDRPAAGWPDACTSGVEPLFRSGDFDGDGRDDLMHLTARDFARPWLSSPSGTSFTVGFVRPWPGYGIQSGSWLTGQFNGGDLRDDLIHLTNSDYAQVWLAKRQGAFSISTYRPWPGYGIQTGSWQKGDFNGDGRTDLAHLTDSDYANIWTSQPNGSFSISTFRPWAGYGIQTGAWWAGDFNGDGLDDLMHLTDGDYANLWLALPGGGFSIKAVRPWAGYGIQTGSWQAGDFNGDGRDDLVHLTDYDYANIWFGQASGGFSVSTFRPWTGYGIQMGSYEKGDFNGDGRIDLLHLTNGDYANVWLGQAGGGFTVRTFRPWAGYGIQTGSYHIGDFNGDGRDDVAHITDLDYANIWLGQPDGSFSIGAFQPWPGYRM